MQSIRDRLRTPLLLLLAAGGLYALFQSGTRPLEAGTRAPGFELGTDEGVVALPAAGVTVLNFWGTYCPPCREEAPVLTRAHGRLVRDGGRVLGVSTDQTPLADVVASARRLGMRYPVALASGELLARYRVDRLPTTYVVAADGRIAASFVGAVDDETLASAIREARR